MRDAKPMTPPGHQPDDLPVHGAEDLGAMAMLTACLIAGGAALVVLAGGYAYHRTTQARIEQLRADVRALNTFTRCESPAKNGDSTVITIRRHADQLLTRCQVITNPHAPERALQ